MFFPALEKNILFFSPVQSLLNKWKHECVSVSELVVHAHGCQSNISFFSLLYPPKIAAGCACLSVNIPPLKFYEILFFSLFSANILVFPPLVWTDCVPYAHQTENALLLPLLLFLIPHLHCMKCFLPEGTILLSLLYTLDLVVRWCNCFVWRPFTLRAENKGWIHDLCSSKPFKLTVRMCKPWLFS